MTYIPLSSLETKLDEIITNTSSNSTIASNIDNWNDGETIWAAKLESLYSALLVELRLLRTGVSTILEEAPELEQTDVPTER